MRRHAVSVLIAGSALLLIGCGSDSKVSSASSQAITSSTAAAPSTSSLTGASTSDISVPATKAVSYLTDVAATAAADGTETITYTFDGATAPGYSVGYVASVPAGEENSTLALKGDNKLRVKFEQASGVNLSGGVTKTYAGPTRFSPAGLTSVTEVAQASDVEAVDTWGVGLTGKPTFAVTSLESPARVAITFTK